MLVYEFLILELFTKDRFASRALVRSQKHIEQSHVVSNTDVATSEVAPLKHELGDHTMKN